MRYKGMRELYVVFAVLLFAMAVYGGVVLCTRWQDCDAGVRIFMLIMLWLVISAFVYVLSALRHPSGYAELRSDGIHLFSKNAEELAFVDWNDAKDCREITSDASNVWYVLLIFQWTAPFGGQPVSVCRKYRLSDTETILRHRLDDLAQKLAEGSMTAEEFKALPYLFLLSDYPHDKGGRTQPGEIEKMWRARRMACRAAEAGGDNTNGP